MGILYTPPINAEGLYSSIPVSYYSALLIIVLKIEHCK